jgi:hypothetical protein
VTETEAPKRTQHLAVMVLLVRIRDTSVVFTALAESEPATIMQASVARKRALGLFIFEIAFMTSSKLISRTLYEHECWRIMLAVDDLVQ